MLVTGLRPNRMMSTLIVVALFTYLALPALLVIGPVSRSSGAMWAFSILAFTSFLVMWNSRTLLSALLVLALTLLFTLGNTAQTISFLTQGYALNSAFFTHLDTSTLRIAWETDTFRTAAVGFYIALTPIFAVWASRTFLVGNPDVHHLEKIAFAGLAIAIVTSYPLHSYASHFQATRQTSERMIAEIARLQVRLAGSASMTKAQKNLVLIYLEGYEQNYLDPAIFPGLTPYLTNKRDSAIWFDDIRQFPGTSWTIGGMVSSQCGVPLLTDGDGNKILVKANNPFSQVTCLAEYLQDDGYRTVYLGGSTLSFAGKGQFLADNGFSVTLGIDELPTSIQHSWGMYDSVLFEQGKRLFNALVDSEAPFLLSMLTLDTHHPSGTPSPGCAPYGDGSETMLDAVHCTDKLLSNFIAYVEQSQIADNTVIALVSDHLLINGAPIKRLKSADRRLTFLIIDPAQKSRRISAPATHFDIAPTLLDALGKSDAEFVFGQSLLTNDMGRAFERNLSEKDFQGFSVEALVSQAAAGEK